MERSGRSWRGAVWTQRHASIRRPLSETNLDNQVVVLFALQPPENSHRLSDPFFVAHCIGMLSIFEIFNRHSWTTPLLVPEPNQPPVSIATRLEGWAESQRCVG